jgi:hypothetical protein
MPLAFLNPSSASAKARRHPHLVAILIFGFVIGDIYSSVLLGHRSLRTDGLWPTGPLFVADPTAGGPITVPLERLASQQWAHLHLPIIDPFQGYGIPLLSNQGVPVYPPQLLVHFLFPGNYSIWNVLNVIAIAFGAYLLASSFGQRFFGAMAVGFAASLAGVVPPNLNMAMLNPFAVFPFVLLSIRYCVDPASDRRIVASLGVATSVALLCLSGFQEVLPLMAVVIAVYTVALVMHFQTLRVRWELLAWAALSGVVGVAIGSIGLVPTLSVVRSASTLNNPGAYLGHAPLFWLSTLTMPSLVQRSMAGGPTDLGQSVWTLGSPLLILVVLLAIAIVLRRNGKHIGWYVWPSAFMVVYGVLGYAGLFHVLQLFDVPLLNSILTVRFLQFAWWIPWCLLLGAVISNARLLRVVDAVVALVLAGLFDLFFVVKFRDAVLAQHLAPNVVHNKSALLLAALTAGIFVAAGLASGRIGSRTSAGFMALIVLGSCLYYLPTNFFPSSSDTAPTSLHIPGANISNGNYLAYLGIAQQPTTYDSVQIWGPIVPHPYLQAMQTLFSAPETNGYGALFSGVPTLGFATMNRRFVDLLRSLGTNVIVTTQALPASSLGPIPPCSTHSQSDSDLAMCFLGHSSAVGGPRQRPGFAYAILGATPLVESSRHLVPVASTGKGLNDFLSTLSPSITALSGDAYVTSGDSHLVPADGVVGISRAATTQSVTLSVRSASAGLVILRESYEPGMRASVNGNSVPALPVDGGLWTAVSVRRGFSRIDLDYARTADLIEFAVAGVGMVGLLLAWLILAAVGIRRKGRTKVGATGAAQRSVDNMSAGEPALIESLAKPSGCPLPAPDGAAR